MADAGPPALRVALIAASSPRSRRLRQLLEESGLAVVLETPIGELADPAALLSDSDVALVNLDEDAVQLIDRLEQLIESSPVPILFNEGGVPGGQGWGPSLVGKLRELAGRPAPAVTAPAVTAPAPSARPALRVVAGEASGAPPRRLWVLGASLGGPQAVKAFLGALPPDIPAAFVLAQHIGRSFVPLLAEQLGRACGLRVAPAQQGQRPMAGEVLVTPSDRRLTFTEAGLVELRDEDIPGAYRPSIDDVLERAAEAYGPRVGAVIFSGMGGDGALGCEEVVRRGGTVLVQDADSCVISSMPDAARARVTIAGSGDPIDLARQVVELTSEADVLSG